MSRGVPVDRPLTYAGPYDPDRTYLPREIVTLDGVPYMATALMQGVTPVPPTPVTPGGGGDVLGAANLFVTIPNVLSDEVYVESTGLDEMDSTSGDPDIAFDGADLVLAASGTPAVYLALGYLSITPNTNTVSSDVFELEFNMAPFGVSTFTGLGVGLRVYKVAGLLALTGTTQAHSRLSAKCSGGTNRQYLTSSSYYLTIVRLASP